MPFSTIGNFARTQSDTAYVLRLCRAINIAYFKMTNVTLSVDQEVLKQARILVLQQGTSVNAVIRDFLKNYIASNQRYQQVTERLLEQAEHSQFESDGRKWMRDRLHER